MKTKSEKKVKKGKILLPLIILLLVVTGVCFLFIPVFKNLNFGLDLQGGFEVLYKVESTDKSKMNQEKLTATYKTLSKRIDSLGVSEPEIILEGSDKIRVKLAGVKKPDQARKQLSTVATLSFRDTDDNLLMNSEVLVSGGAKVSEDSSGNPAVLLSVKDKDRFYNVTNKISKQKNNQIVIWLDYDENKDSYREEASQCGTEESNCLSAASVSQGFASNVIIQGKFTQEEVQNLVDLINSGSLPSKLTEISSQTVGASFGSTTLEKTLIAGIVGIAAIILIMIIAYRFAGIISSCSIILYTFLVFLIFWLIGGVLTLPGIAALVLGIGMAIDANVITFSRIREELFKGKSVKNAFKEGTKESLSSILDSNITTLIVAIIMFIYGESSVKGFATVLIITILVTMFTMVFLTRLLLKLFVKTSYFDDKPETFINVGSELIPDVSKKEEIKVKPFSKVNLFKYTKPLVSLSIIIMVCGGIFFGIRGLNLGIDYKAGSSITIDTSEKVSKKELKSDIKELDLDATSIEVGSKENTVKISNVLKKDEIKEVNDYFEDKYNAKVSIGVVSNIVKEELTKNAFISVLLAIIGIICYMSIRFKFNYAISAVAALLHDIIVVFALFSIFNIEISVIFIAAILTIVGYSINDTIVCFDRIRENIKKHSSIKKIDKEDIVKICEKSTKETLVRTVYTSLTTLLPVVSLMILGSNGILTFNLAMLFGIIVGTYSSIFIATNLFIWLEKKSLAKPKKKKKIYKDDIQEKKIKGVNC